jgi:hypothetical protein
MEIKIKNSYLSESIEFLYNLSLKGKQSRHRTRFVKLLQSKLKQVGEEEVELLKEYAGVDDNGEINRHESGSFAIEDVVGFNKQQNELFNEDFIIEGGDYHGMLKTVKEILFDYDGEVSGKTAEVFDYLCEIFEKGEEL